ncbi:MAG: helix-turn-helix transcriptional regulator [Rhodobacteraceae bacterium]|nr:helix-turn-helix transcriptional regulator [Paracoccaceae bacterium]
MRALGLRWPFLVVLVLVLIIQVASSLFFIFNLLADVFLIRVPFIPWEVQEILQILASFGLLSGVLCSVAILALSFKRMRKIEGQIEAAAGQFQTHIDGQFDAWALTPTERQIALLVIKGFSNSEVASLRKSTESTVKSHLTSIFRKSGLNSRQQLVASVIEDLIAALSEQ